jgi:hypothetical protein
MLIELSKTATNNVTNKDDERKYYTARRKGRSENEVKRKRLFTIHSIYVYTNWRD